MEVVTVKGEMRKAVYKLTPPVSIYICTHIYIPVLI